MRLYRRVTYEDRIKIEAFIASGLNIGQIAKKLSFHKATIGREINRNRSRDRYLAITAHRRSLVRYQCCRKLSKFTPQLKRLIVSKLKKGWSPEQIAGRLRLERGRALSHQTIYNWLIRHPSLGANRLRRFSKRGGGRHIVRNKKLSFVPIAKRPLIVSLRRRRGDWERDGMYVADRNQLLVFSERKSRYTRIKKMGHAKPREITELTKRVLRSVPIRAFSVTNDRGPEFNDYKSLAIPTYFCDIQKPQQKGTIENAIGLIRQYIKRSTDYKSLTAKTLRVVENRLNHRPRKVLDYKTPFEVLFKKKVALIN